MKIRNLVPIIVLTLVSHAQQTAMPATSAMAPVASRSDAPDACHSFTVTGGNNSILYCVSDNGNIPTIQTPIGQSQIGVNGEGYGLCQESPATEYHDYASDASSNWAAARIVSLTGSSIKISRSTADGGWTLVQTISKVAATASIKVVMALTNNQSVDRVAYLVRFADANANEGANYGDGGAAIDSAWAWHINPNDGSYQHFGFQLQNAAKSPFAYQHGFVQEIPNGPNACAFAFNDAGGLVEKSVDLSIVYAYVGVVGSHGTKIVTLSYHSM